VKKKKRRTTDLEKESIEEEDVEEESVEEEGVEAGGRQVLSVMEVTRRKEGGGMQNSNAGGFECRAVPD